MKLGSVLRFLLAITLLSVSCFLVGVDELLAIGEGIRWHLFILLVLFSAVMIWASCVKWQVFVRAAGHDIGVLRLMRFYTLGYFYNSFLPSYFGGDIARSLYLGDELSNLKSGFATTLLERFTGLLAMTLLGAVFVAVGAEVTAGVELAILIVAICSVICALVLFSEKVSSCAFSIIKSVSKIFPKVINEKINWFIDKLDQAMAFSRSDTRLFLVAMFWSFIFHLLTVINTYLAAITVGWDNPDLSGLFVVVPLVLLISMIPITPSGLGLQEGAFLFFLSRLGASQGEALGVGLVLRVKVFIIAIIGGLLWANLSSHRVSKESPKERGKVDANCTKAEYSNEQSSIA